MIGLKVYHTLGRFLGLNRKNCKDCPDRTLWCHSKCEVYKALKEYYASIKRAKAEENAKSYKYISQGVFK